jgi:hypothetical protein
MRCSLRHNCSGSVWFLFLAVSEFTISVDPYFGAIKFFLLLSRVLLSLGCIYASAFLSGS